MRYLPRLSLSVWALLALLAGSSVACLAPAFGADQKPLVINPTTGRTEQIQSGNNLSLPANGYTQANTYTDPAANYNPFLVDTTTTIPAGNNAFTGSNRFIFRTSGANNFTAAAGVRAFHGSAIHNGTGVVTGAWGINGDVAATNTGNITRAISVRAGSVSTSAGNVIATGNGVYISAPGISGGGAMTTFNALEIEPISGAGTNRAIYTQGAGLVRISDTTSSSSSITGAVVIGDASTAATNVGIGGGNITTGGTLTTGGAARFNGTVRLSGAPLTYQGITVTPTLSGATAHFGVNVAPTYGSDATSIRGVASNITTAAAAFTVTNSYGLYVNNPTKGAGSAITNAHGLYIEGLTAGATNNIAINCAGAGLVYVADTTQSSSKDTGAIITEGGIGSEKSVTSGGNFIAGVAGGGLLVKEGTNAKMGAATLVAGTVTVNTTAVTASSRIYLTSQSDGGTPGFQRISARSAGTSFTITSSNVLDTSTVAWMIVEPAP